ASRAAIFWPADGSPDDSRSTAEPQTTRTRSSCVRNSYISFPPAERWATIQYRSEEHTSELQSLRHLVCRLLLEKKKTKSARSIVVQDRADPAALGEQRVAAVAEQIEVEGLCGLLRGVSVALNRDCLRRLARLED